MKMYCAKFKTSLYMYHHHINDDPHGLYGSLRTQCSYMPSILSLFRHEFNKFNDTECTILFMHGIKIIL